MDVTIQGSAGSSGSRQGLVGTAPVAADKSISHRLAILAALAEGTSELRNYSTGADCRSTLECLRRLGVKIEESQDESGRLVVRVTGSGLGGLQAPSEVLDAGNSGTTMRLLGGVLAGCGLDAEITGDESLRRRPMGRVVKPLREMGARITTAEGGRPPLRFEAGGGLASLDYTVPVASAQVKSAILLAGLYAEGVTAVEEPVRTRDHTEQALVAFGAEVTRKRLRVEVQGRPKLKAGAFDIPGDLSAAAFLLVAGLMLSETNLAIPGVGLNPTRTALLDFLAGQSGEIKILNVEDGQGELRGELHVRGGQRLTGGEISGADAAKMIDELPVLAVLGTQTEKGIVIRDAGELRVKESDRIHLVAEGLRRMGAQVEEFPDGLSVDGNQRLRGAEIGTAGDHRIAMAFAVAGLVAQGETVIRDAECAEVSFPGFFEVLEELRKS